MQYLIGIDGGGTKTALCAVSTDGSIRLSSRMGGCSWREHGVETVVHNIRQAVYGMLESHPGDILGMAVGLPCYGESAQGDLSLKKEMDSAFSNVPFYLTNDVEIGWAGSLGLQPGINVVSGTGSIAYGADREGHHARSGGWDEFYSDEGSCYWLGRKMMELFSKEADGRLPRGSLYTLVRQEFDLHEDIEFIDLIRSRYMVSREKIASLQLLLERAALAGDEEARLLYQQAASELCLLVSAVKSRLDFSDPPCRISYSGGVFKAGELILPYFQKGIEQLGGVLVSPAFQPVEGAVLLAAAQFAPEERERMEKILLSPSDFPVSAQNDR